MGNEFTPESQSLCDRRGAEDTPSGPSNPAHILLGGRAGGGREADWGSHGNFGRDSTHFTSDKLCGFGQAAYFPQVQSHGQRRGADHQVPRFPGALQSQDAGPRGKAGVGRKGLAAHVPGPRELVDPLPCESALRRGRQNQ